VKESKGQKGKTDGDDEARVEFTGQDTGDGHHDCKGDPAG
jgi:hypothetical protein